MSTTQPRINVTLTPDLMALLSPLAEKRACSLSALVKAYIEQGLALEEDSYFSALSTARLQDARPALSAEEFWAHALDD